MATFGRFKEIIIFLDSLLNQSYKNFELIIVDQNGDDKLEKLCQSYSMNIQVIKNPVKGLSLNRNIGLKYVTGDIIAFPDDDCEYDSKTLENVVQFFTNNQDYGFYTCSTKEKTNDLSILANNTGDTEISIKNIMYVGISFTIFVKKLFFDKFVFDEQLGIGAEFGSAEESDLLFYLLKNRCKGFYHSTHYIYHPYKPETVEKAFQYGKGYGAIHKKAVIVYKYYMVLYPFFKLMLIELIKICFYQYLPERLPTFKGRIYGFFYYKPGRRKL